jgi:hypothetical protein
MQIEVEDIKTYPSDVIEIFERNFDHLRLYEQERQRLWDLKDRDRLAFGREPPNKYDATRRKIIAHVTELAADAEFIGYHSTRLCEDEIEDIHSQGMALSSVDFLKARIDRRVSAGDISKSIADILKSQNEAHQKFRTSMFWFVNGSSGLKFELGLYRFFRYWGGEALYSHYENNITIAPILQKIGTPCIVKASLPLAKYQIFLEVGRILYAAFMGSRGIRTEDGVGTQGYMQSPLSPGQILKTIKYADDEFRTLTDLDTWRLKIMG